MSTALFDQNIDTLNSLLRGELSAVESYEDVLPRFEDEPQEADLRRIANQHWGAIESLREQVIDFGGEPAIGSGPWGYFTAVVTRAATLIGPQTILSALKKGEEHGVQAYEEALAHEELSDTCRILISTRFLPQTRTHVQTLESLIEHMS